MAHNTVGSCNRDRQSAAVALKVATDTHVLSGHLHHLVDLLAGCCHLLGALTILSLSTTLLSQTVLLCLTSPALSSLTGFLVPGSLSLCLGFLLTGLGLGNTAGILAGHTLSLGLLTGQLSSTLLGRLRLSTALSLCCGTCFLASHLLGYQTVNLGIQRSVFLLLLGYDALNGLLLLL